MANRKLSSEKTFLHRHLWTIILVVVIVGAKVLASFLPKIEVFESALLESKWISFLEHVFISAIVLLVFRLIYKFTSARVERIFDENEERIFYSKIYGWLLFSIAAFTVLNLFGLSLDNITLFVGIIATGFAFAVREVLLSFIGWLILLRKKPFRIGDFIKIGEHQGKVVHIGTYYVIIDKTTDIPDDFIRIPNRFFLEKSIEKLGKSQSHEQIKLRLSNNPPDRAERIETLRERMKTLTPELKLISAHLDIDHDKLYLDILTLVPFEGKSNWRSQIVQLVLDIFGDVAYFPKE
jgi:small-conductance mechanosensitive channel